MNHENHFKKEHMINTSPRAKSLTPELKLVSKTQSAKTEPRAKKMLIIQVEKSRIEKLTAKAKPTTGEDLNTHEKVSAQEMQSGQEEKNTKGTRNTQENNATKKGHLIKIANILNKKKDAGNAPRNCQDPKKCKVPRKIKVLEENKLPKNNILQNKNLPVLKVIRTSEGILLLKKEN